MKLNISIPTKNRVKKLERAIESIIKSKEAFDKGYLKEGNEISLNIYFDNIDNMKYIMNKMETRENPNLPWINFYNVIDYRVPDFWNKILWYMKEDALCYMNDDIEFHEDTLNELFKTYQEKYPDYDGIVGINQSNLPVNQCLPSAFGVIGKKYAKRFELCEVFCPEYNRFFADEELYRYVTKINKFYFAENIKINHYHASFYKHEKDDTHVDARQYWAHDNATFTKRKIKGKLWGDQNEV